MEESLSYQAWEQCRRLLRAKCAHLKARKQPGALHSVPAPQDGATLLPMAILLHLMRPLCHRAAARKAGRYLGSAHNPAPQHNTHHKLGGPPAHCIMS